MKLLSFVILIELCLCCCNCKPHGSDSGGLLAVAFDGESIRLPGETRPISYAVELSVNIHNGSTPYNGRVAIRIAVDAATDVITLHNKGLVVERVRVIDKDGEELLNSYELDVTRDFMNINVERLLMAGEEYTVEIDFNGSISMGTSGFYRLSYRNVDTNELKYLAATKFEPAYLRSAIICYDEPALKATFDLKITHDASLLSISNTDGFRLRNVDGTITTTFEQSPIMSPYLLAFIVSDFDYSSIKNGPTLHRIYARPDNGAVLRTQFALRNSDLVLKELERYVAVGYELSKLDQAALPDFQAGAMENWGLITYKEQYLIVDENSHHREIMESVRVTSHELAHQFFGNVITAEWWNFIWLHEGFATLLEYHVPNIVFPEYRIEQMFNLQLQNGLRIDAEEAVRPMTNSLETNEQLPGIFDRIAYDKSGSVLRMFQRAVGDEIFRDGLNRLITENKHKAITPRHFYEALQASMDARGFTDFKFADAFATWELQSGHPVVHVSLERDNNQLRITQKRYLNAETNSIDSSSWFIPLNFAHANNPDFNDTTITHYFEHGTSEKTISIVDISGFDSSDWFVFNKQQLNFYRVNYDEDNWYNIIRALNSKSFSSIHVLNRAQLVDDALNFAIDGYIGFDIALGVLSYLEHENEYLPFAAASHGLDRLDYLLLGSEVREAFHEFVNHLVARLFARHGTEQRQNDGILTKYAREFSINWACRTGHGRCLQETYERLSSTEIVKPLEIAFLCNGLRASNRTEEFVYFWRKLEASTDQSERLRLIDGLACSSEPENIKSFLQTSIASNSDVNYHLHERPRIFNAILTSSSVGISEALDFLAEYFFDVQSTFQQPGDALLISVSKRIVSKEHEEILMEALNKLSGVLQATTKDLVLKNVEYNKNFKQSSKVSTIHDFLVEYLDGRKNNEHHWRLPKNSAPISYDLHLKSNVHSGSLDVAGEVAIKLKIIEATDTLTLHSRNLIIDDLQLFSADGTTKIPIVKFSLYAPTDMLTIYLVDTATVGEELLLVASYRFRMNDSPVQTGFYRTSYVSSTGATRYVGATHLVHTYARGIMPCYDEPSFPAHFNLHITHHESYQAISNTEGVRRQSGEEIITTDFEETPLMSTYLIGFVVSDFESTTNEMTKEPQDTLHRISARSNANRTTAHPLELSENLLKILESYLDADYELSKLDSAAIPGKDGPIVVWGLIAYTETLISFEENFDETPHQQRYDQVVQIAHELVHQFFGNAVLIDYWTHLWLIEGFTSLLEYPIAGTLFPDWRDRDFFNLHRIQYVFTEDERKSAPAMTQEVETIDEIEGNFGPIAYYKAGSVLRMFENAIKPEVFRQAISYYLKNNHHKVVDPTDFYAAFVHVLAGSNFDAFNFTEAFRTWELQKGYPVIHVKYNKERRQFNVTQKRFFIDSSLTDDANSTWTIPLNFATSTNPNFGDTTFTHYFEHQAQEKIIQTSGDSEWFVFNKQQIGHYRVNYDFENWHSLIQVLNSENYQQIHVLNRAQLIDDAMALAQAGLIDFDVASGVLMYLRHETDYIPWASASIHLNRLSELFGGRNEKLNSFVEHLSRKLYSSYPFINNEVPNEPIVDRFARETAIKWACQAGSGVCRYDTFAQIQHGRSIPKGLEEVIYCNGLRGNESRIEWIAMWRKMQASSEIDERTVIINSLGCSDDYELLRDLLQSSIATNSDNNYSRSERFQIFNSVLQSSVGVKATVEFLQKHESDGIAQIYGQSITNLAGIVAEKIYNPSDLTTFVIYLANRANFPAELVGTLTRRANENLEKQNENAVQKILSSMASIVVGWEQETTTMNPPSTTVTTQPTTEEQTTTSITNTPSTESPSTTEDAPTTLGASSLSKPFSMIIVVILIALYNLK